MTMSDRAANLPVATGVTPERLKGLRRWNIGLAVVLLGMAGAILALTNDFAIPVLASYVDGAPGSLEGGGAESLVTFTLFNLTIGYAVTAFLALAGLDHLITATIGRGIYESDLKRGVNRFRWAEYSVSATLMVIVLAMYWGIVTINALVAVAGANIAMILFGYLQERMNPPGRTTTTMVPFWFGSLVGIMPWIAMSINIPLYSDAPQYIFVTLGVQGVLFFCFGLNQWLQYTGVGRWKDYACGEKCYLVLSMTAKSLLA